MINRTTKEREKERGRVRESTIKKIHIWLIKKPENLTFISITTGQQPNHIDFYNEI